MPRRKALKVVVDVEFHAVTCPGVFLSEREDIFINVEIMGQRKRTRCVPAVFPFLFHEKIRFEKVFGSATDPVQVATVLCTENVIIELVQLSYPTGNLLATYEDNARDFLFPTPRITPTYPGVDREVLMQRSATFPGIAPKLEFSSRTTIKEVTSGGTSLSNGSSNKQRHRTKSAQHTSAVPNYERREKSPQKQRATSGKKKVKKSSKNVANDHGRGRERARSAHTKATTMWGYEQPTIASRARSPSPYARRRMAELSINDPFETATVTKPFKTEIDAKPDFVVRKVAEDALSLENTPRSPRSISSERKFRSSYSPIMKTSKSPKKRSNYLQNGYTNDADSEESWDTVSSSEDNEMYNKIANFGYSKPSRVAQDPPWHHLSAYSDYLATKNERPFLEGRHERICPFKPTHCRIVKYPMLPERHVSSTPKGENRYNLINKSRIKENFRKERTPGRLKTNVPQLPVYDLNTAERITTQLKDILADLDSACSSTGSAISPSKRHRTVRFKDVSDTMGSSLRCGRNSPTVPPSTRSDPTSSPRRFDSSLSKADLEPVSRYSGENRHRNLTPNSILLRTPLEERMSKRESPYDKIRDRVRTLLESPRAVAIAEDADRLSRDSFRRHRSRSPSPRSPRVSVRMTDKGDYWNEKAASYSGKSHRQVFEGNLDKMYDDIYDSIKSSKK